jgi:hypothetical protein
MARKRISSCGMGQRGPFQFIQSIATIEQPAGFQAFLKLFPVSVEE